MERAPVTLEDIERLPRDMLTAEDIAGYLECGPHQIRIQARTEPALLGFPVIVQGTRVRIPKAGFLFFMRYGHPVPGGEAAS